MLNIIIGCLLLTAPFIMLTVFMFKQDGWVMVLSVWGFVILTVGTVVMGVYLICNELGAT